MTTIQEAALATVKALRKTTTHVDRVSGNTPATFTSQEFSAELGKQLKRVREPGFVPFDARFAQTPDAFLSGLGMFQATGDIVKGAEGTYRISAAAIKIAELEVAPGRTPS